MWHMLLADLLGEWLLLLLLHSKPLAASAASWQSVIHALYAADRPDRPVTPRVSACCLLVSVICSLQAL
jgi:hypothetical protein